MTVSDTRKTAEPAGLDPESRKLVLDTMRQLRKKLLTKENVLEWDKNEIFPEKAIRKMLGPEIGLQLIFIPEAYGGIGGGAKDCCVVIQEMSRICLGVATAFFAIQLGADPLLVAGTEEQKKKWLGAVRWVRHTNGTATSNRLRPPCRYPACGRPAVWPASPLRR